MFVLAQSFTMSVMFGACRESQSQLKKNTYWQFHNVLIVGKQANPHVNQVHPLAPRPLCHSVDCCQIKVARVVLA